MDPAPPTRRARGRLLDAVVILVASLVLTALSLNLFRDDLGDAQIYAPRTAAMEMRRAAEMWRGTHPPGDCPTGDQLRADRALDPAFKLTDHWGTPFNIVCEEDETFVISLGPDGKESGDDIVVPESVRQAGSRAK